MHARAARAMVVGMALTAAGCAPRAPSVVQLRLNSDIAASRVQDVTVSARWDSPTSEPFVQSPYSFVARLDDGGTLGFPGSVLVVPSDAVDGRAMFIEAALRLRGQSAVYVIARARVDARREATVVAELYFADACGASGQSARCATDPTQQCRANGATTSCVVVGSESTTRDGSTGE